MGQGLYLTAMCGLGPDSAAGDSNDGLPDGPPAFPTSEEACDQMKAGFANIFNHPGLLIHSDEWSTDWQKAAGLTMVDLLTLKLPGMGKLAGTLGELGDGLAAGIARGLTDDLAAGITTFGAKTIQNAVAELGAINLAKILEIANTIPAKFTFNAEEIGAMRTAVNVKGVAIVEQTLESLSDSTALQAIKKLLKSCLGNSFTADTKVLLADGTRKPIGDLRVGDRVLTTDPYTGATQPEPVTDLHHNTDRAFSDVTIVDPHGRRQTIHTTWEHPFWDMTMQSWTAAAALRHGDDLRTAAGGQARVFEVRSYRGSRTMHDLTIADVHTFYVNAGDVAVLVHNCGSTVALGVDEFSEALAEQLRKLDLPDVKTFNDDSFGVFDPESGFTKWQLAVKNALKDPTAEIHIALDGLDGASPIEKFLNSYRLAKKTTDWGATDWEMGEVGLAVRRGFRSWQDFKWYEKGKLIGEGTDAGTRLGQTDEGNGLMGVLFHSDRYFKVWRYSVSHRVLLLRSTRDDIHPTRIDVVFGQVSRMLLVPAFTGLTISATTSAQRDAAVAKIGGALGRHLYFLDAEGTNFVASGPPQWHEDEGSYRDPSYFQQMLML